MDEKRIEALWDCVFCGNKGILGRYDTCPNCGKGRGVETVFYLPEDVQSAVLSREEAAKTTNRADWLCAYCGTYNRADREHCIKCGALRSDAETDYGSVNSQTDFGKFK